ncbi:MAG: hypothetical protein R3B66_13420 [Candidatus Scalinduaceae bacterium]
MKKNDFKSKCKITNIGITNDTLTGRGGMALFVFGRYYERCLFGG